MISYGERTSVPGRITPQLRVNFLDNIEEAVDKLTKSGVRFERYEGDVKTDEKGIFRSCRH